LCDGVIGLDLFGDYEVKGEWLAQKIRQALNPPYYQLIVKKLLYNLFNLQTS